jgi:hypothetical protein
MLNRWWCNRVTYCPTYLICELSPFSHQEGRRVGGGRGGCGAEDRDKALTVLASQSDDFRQIAQCSLHERVTSFSFKESKNVVS